MKTSLIIFAFLLCWTIELKAQTSSDSAIHRYALSFRTTTTPMTLPDSLGAGKFKGSVIVKILYDEKGNVLSANPENVLIQYLNQGRGQGSIYINEYYPENRKYEKSVGRPGIDPEITPKIKSYFDWIAKEAPNHIKMIKMPIIKGIRYYKINKYNRAIGVIEIQ